MLCDKRQHTCMIVNTGTRNDMLAVEFITNCTGGVEVLCRLLSRFEGEAKCEVLYRLLPSDTGYTDTSEGSGGAGDTLSVVLSVLFEANTVLSVMVTTVGGLQDVTIEGTFVAGIWYTSEYNNSLPTFSCITNFPNKTPLLKITLNKIFHC